MEVRRECFVVLSSCLQIFSIKQMRKYIWLYNSMQNLRTDCPSTHVFLCALFFIEQKMFNSPHICYAFARFKYSYFDSWSTVLCTYSTCVPELSQTVIKSITVDVCYALVTPWSLHTYIRHLALSKTTAMVFLTKPMHEEPTLPMCTKRLAKQSWQWQIGVSHFACKYKKGYAVLVMEKIIPEVSFFFFFYTFLFPFTVHMRL